MLNDHTFEKEKFDSGDNEAEKCAAQKPHVAGIHTSDKAEECKETCGADACLDYLYGGCGGEACNYHADEGNQLVSCCYCWEKVVVGYNGLSIIGLIVSVHIFTCLSVLGVYCCVNSQFGIVTLEFGRILFL
jgi:hypothetical protein